LLTFLYRAFMGSGPRNEVMRTGVKITEVVVRPRGAPNGAKYMIFRD
jgi:hypothetical protein